MKNEKNLLITTFALFVLLILSIISTEFMQLIHGFTQIIYGGNSDVKTFIVLTALIVLSLISFFSLKIKTENLLKKKQFLLFLNEILKQPKQ